MKLNHDIPGEKVFWINPWEGRLSAFLLEDFTCIGFEGWEEDSKQLQIMTSYAKNLGLKTAYYTETFPENTNNFDYIRYPNELFRIDAIPEKSFIVDITYKLHYR